MLNVTRGWLIEYKFVRARENALVLFRSSQWSPRIYLGARSRLSIVWQSRLRDREIRDYRAYCRHHATSRLVVRVDRVNNHDNETKLDRLIPGWRLNSISQSYPLCRAHITSDFTTLDSRVLRDIILKVYKRRADYPSHRWLNKNTNYWKYKVFFSKKKWKFVSKVYINPLYLTRLIKCNQ